MEGKRRFVCLMLSTIAVCLSGGFGCSEKPANWYYYWEKDDVITGLDADGSPASRWSSNSSYYGGASGPDNGYALSDLCINEPKQSPKAVWHKVTGQQVLIGCTTTFGIEMAAITMTHEKQHITNYQFIQLGNPDTDHDRLADSQEGIPPYNLIIGEKDTYDLAKEYKYQKYANYGDDEFICRKEAEPSGLPLAKLNEDWSKDGAQWEH